MENTNEVVETKTVLTEVELKESLKVSDNAIETIMKKIKSLETE